MQTLWIDNRLTTACRYGHTLVYDEFTRSRAEANNVLLSVLGEEILNLPKRRYAGEGYLKVDPEFRAIFTSNPEEYAGIHTSQDALMDRLSTNHVDYFDRETEVAIVAAASGISHVDAGRVVDLVRHYRDSGWTGTGRAFGVHHDSRIVVRQGTTFDPTDPIFSEPTGGAGAWPHRAHGENELRSLDVIHKELGECL